MVKQLHILGLLFIIPLLIPFVSAEFAQDTLSEITLQSGDTNIWILADYKDIDLRRTINDALNTGATVKLITLGVNQDSIQAGIYGECIYHKLGKEIYLEYVDDLYYGNTQVVANSYVDTNSCDSLYSQETYHDIQNSLYYFNNEIKNTLILSLNEYLDQFEYTSIIKLRVQEIFDKLYVNDYTNSELAVFFESLSVELNSLKTDIIHEQYHLNSNDRNLIVNNLEFYITFFETQAENLEQTPTDTSRSSILIYEGMAFTQPIDTTDLSLLDQVVDNHIFDEADVYLSNGLYVIETDYEYDKFYLDFIEVNPTKYRIGNKFQYEIPYKKGLLIKGLKFDSIDNVERRFRVTLDDLEYTIQDPSVELEKAGNTYTIETFYSGYTYFVDGVKINPNKLATNKVEFTSNGNTLIGQKMDTANGIIYKFETQLKSQIVNEPQQPQQLVELNAVLSSNNLIANFPISQYVNGNEVIQVGDNALTAQINQNTLTITLADPSKLYEGLSSNVIVENDLFKIEVDISVSTSTPVLVAVADVPNGVSVGDTVTLSAQNSIASIGTSITNYIWNIDGNSYTGSQVNHQFNTEGTSNVQLTITNNLGQTQTSNYDVNVFAASTVTNFLVLNPIEDVVTFADVSIDISDYIVNEDDNYTVTVQSNNNNIIPVVNDNVITIGAANVNGIHTGIVTLSVTDGILTVSRDIQVTYQKTIQASFQAVSIESKIEIKEVTLWFDDDKERVKSETERISNIKPGMKLRAEVEVCNRHSRSSDIDFEDLEFSGTILDLDIESKEFDLDAGKCEDIELILDSDLVEFDIEEGKYQFELFIDAATDRDSFKFEMEVEKNRRDTHINNFELKATECGLEFESTIFNIGTRDTEYKLISPELNIEQTIELEEGDDHNFNYKYSQLGLDSAQFELYEEDELIAYETIELNLCQKEQEVPVVVHSTIEFDPIQYEGEIDFDFEIYEKEISTKVAKKTDNKFGKILIISSFMMLILIISVFVYAGNIGDKDDSDSRYL